MLKKVITLFMVGIIVGTLVSCSDIEENESKNLIKSAENITTQEIIIGDEIIYGDSFSLEEIYENIIEGIEDSSRAIISRCATANEESLEIKDSDIVEMVYFSVQPTTIESVKLVNEKMGYLNPTELDKDIIQTCDAEKIIFKTENITDSSEIEENINFDAKYYYITEKQIASEFENELENFEYIEEFEMLTQTALNRIKTEYENCASMYGEDIFDEDETARGIFKKLGSGIKKIATTIGNKTTTVATAVINFLIKKYEIKGKVVYKFAGKENPAYGVKVYNMAILGETSEIKKDGSFNLGSRTDSAGLCFLWLEYENKACKLSNFLGITASTLVKTALPSYLQNVTIKSSSDYANAKMAICNELLTRYENENCAEKKVPKAKIWTTEFGNGTSSAPSFHLIGSSILPDIILTGVTATSSNGPARLKTLHHEYTHFLHCFYTNNKKNFWDDVVLSEIGCTIANATVGLINKIFSTDLNTGYNGSYNFSNKYVCFTENLAEWYKFVGASHGVYFQGENSDGKYYIVNSKYDNQIVFSSLMKKVSSANEIIKLIDDYDIITFQELYNALIIRYPTKKTDINKVFSENYKSYGNNINFK